LPRSATPVEPTIPRLFDGLVDAAPALPTARASALNEFRGSITRLWHLLPTLQDWSCHHPCKAGWLARLYREGVEPSGSLQKVSDHISRPPFLDLSWRKGSFILNHEKSPTSRAGDIGSILSDSAAEDQQDTRLHRRAALGDRLGASQRTDARRQSRRDTNK
jgi:hypothetical protein